VGRLVDALLRRVARAGFRRALSGGHWAWIVVAVAAFVLRRVRRSDDPVTSVALRPGDRYLLSLRNPSEPVADSAAG
jgi:hypothetical protein